MLCIIAFTIIISFSLSVPVVIDTCPIDYTGLNDCNQYNAPTTNANICCDNNNNVVEYSNRCIAECNNNDQVYSCGKCCQISDDCPTDNYGTPGNCMTNGTPDAAGYCYGLHHQCPNYQPPCDAQNSCAYKGNDQICVENSYTVSGGGTPATTGTEYCYQCICEPDECGFGTYSKSCPSPTDSCQSNNPFSYDSCGTCRNGIIDTCPGSSRYNCGNYFGDTTTPVCCFQEMAHPQKIVQYSNMCIAECSGEFLNYCGPCCDRTNVCPGSRTCFNPNNETMGACTLPYDQDCFVQLTNEAPCDDTDPGSCAYRGEGGVSCVSKAIPGSALVCGECQDDPTTTSSPGTTGTTAAETSTTSDTGTTTTTSSAATTTTDETTTSSPGTTTTTSSPGTTTTTSSPETSTTDETTTSGVETTADDSCVRWGQNGLDYIEGVCKWCFKNQGREILCSSFAYTIVTDGTGTAAQKSWWFDFSNWAEGQVDCFIAFCPNLNCDKELLNVKEGVELDENNCGCDAFECVPCKSECDDNTPCDEGLCQENNAPACNKCVECLGDTDCPGETCQNNVCGGNGNGNDANQIGVMITIAYVMSVFGWM